jgi:flagellar M-ring protein FliF
MANPVSNFWSGLGRGARAALLGGATLLLAVLVSGLFLAFRQDYRVLFAELAEADAGAVVAKLKQEKVPYRLSDDGTAILVPAEQVHDLRLTLMAGDLPLRGGVGFEIFDKQGLGVTEHSQRVSYQRALQGELARTIGSLDNVKQVRVHLVMPESTLFTRDRQQASAAVALTMRPGSALESQQIVGVQRLVAAAVPGLAPERVVVTDQRGVTVSSADVGAVGAGAADARLQVKREIEDYIAHKVARLLDGAFGPGQAIVSVDAALNFDATKTTIQDLLPGGNGAVEGRVVRRRQLMGAATAEPSWTSTVDGAAAPPARSPNSSLEVEFEYGRRIDEIIAAPGAITRVSVGVVVPDAVTEERRAKVAELVKMAAGIDERRGDAITVQALSQLGLAPGHAGDVEPVRGAPEVQQQRTEPSADSPYSAGLIGVLILFAIALIAFGVRRRSPVRALSAQERESLIDDIQRALGEESRATRGPAR